MESLLLYVTRLHPLSPESIRLIGQHISKQQVKKGTELLTFGSVCKHLYFIEQGLLRGYFLENGKEITDWFAYENELVNALGSFLSQKPSQVAIEVLEDTMLWSISYQDLHKLFAQSTEINTLGRLLIERCYLEMEERNRLLQTKPATWLYHNLITQNPKLANRISLKHLASYLGITPERLSRIRATK